MKHTEARAWSLTAKSLLVFLVVACQNPQKVVIPQDTIPADSMSLLLTDMHLVDGAKVGRRMIGDSLGVVDYYNKIYSKYNISEKRFTKSFNFYSSHPALMNDIYDQVLENLNKLDVQPPREKLEVVEASDSIVKKE